MLPKKDSLEVVVPVFNEEECLDELVRRLLALRERMAGEADVSFTFVNDGSRDATIDKLVGYAGRYPFLGVVDLSRNFGHQIAVTAGLDHARADYVAILDGDLQDPPELVEEMYRRARAGADIVYGRRLSRKGETLFKKLTARMFYRTISRTCSLDIPEDTGDFRLVSRRVVEAIRSMREKHRFLRGMVPWVGFRSEVFPYHRDERYAGRTKYPLRKMARFAVDAILSFSSAPLRMATYLGISIAALGIVGGLVLLYLGFFTEYPVPGIAAAILAIVLVGGLQIIMLGVIGEYIGRIFEESKRRPLYFLNRTINFPVPGPSVPSRK